MILYEVSSYGQPAAGKHSTRSTEYFTSKQAGVKWYTALRKKGLLRWILLFKCDLTTVLKAEDWCQLLQGDAPGITCNLTPQDLITKRKLILKFEDEKGGHHASTTNH